MLKKKIILSMIIFSLSFNVAFIIPNNVNMVSAKTTTLKELKKIKKENEKMRKKFGAGGLWYQDLYKCKGRIIRWDEYKSNFSSSFVTYYKLKADSKTLKLICTIERKAYFDEKADRYKSRYMIKRTNSTKYVKLSKKKLEKLEKKYKIIKRM